MLGPSDPRPYRRHRGEATVIVGGDHPDAAILVDPAPQDRPLVEVLLEEQPILVRDRPEDVAQGVFVAALEVP